MKHLLLLSFLLLTLFSSAAISKKPNTNSLGTVQYQSNPYTYFEGSLVSGAIIEPGVNLRFQPRGTYNLFTQEILFCDYNTVAQKFSGKQGLLVLSYETVAHRMIQGIGCHSLRSVDEVKEDKLQ